MPNLTQSEARQRGRALLKKMKGKGRQRGRALLKKMKGKGWKLRVWESFGWHYSVILPSLAVYENFEGAYSVLLSNGKGPYGGEIYWTPTECRTYRDPNAAVRAQMKLAKAFERRTTHNLEAMRKALAG